MSSVPTATGHASDGHHPRTVPQVELPANPASALVKGKEAEDWAEDASATSHSPTDPRLLKQTLRKIDVIVLPVMTLLLAFCFIDRANMGLAAVAGMTRELKIVGYQYSISLLVFFPGYALFAIPSNYLLTKTSVRYWITFLSLGFGLFTLAMGLVRSFTALAVMRVFLGVFEAGVFPAIIVVLSSWYPRHRLGKRMAFVFCGASVISSLAGVLAYAFSRINAAGYAGWRWIFILEGIITIVIVIGCYFALDEYPQKSRFLNQEQRDIAVSLIAQDRAEHEEDKMTLKNTLSALNDWTLWALALMYLCCTTTTYSFAYFMPLILNAQMGFSGALSQVLTTPPYFWAFGVAMSMGWLSDKKRLRSPFILFFSANVLLGVTLTRWGPNTGSQYLGLFFTLAGAQGNVATTVSFGQNNAPTRIKRSVSSGLQLSFGAIGGIIGSTVFRSQDAPSYTPGVITVLCTCGLLSFLAMVLAFHFHRQNKAHREHGKILEGDRTWTFTL